MRTENRKSPSPLHCFAFHRFVYKKYREIKTIILILTA